MNNFQCELYIVDEASGYVALAASVILQAVEDVRLALEAPEFGAEGTKAKDEQKARIRFKTRTTERRVKAAQAAKWLSSAHCRDLCELLEQCGFPVPMQRFFRELNALKQKGAAHHG